MTLSNLDFALSVTAAVFVHAALFLGMMWKHEYAWRMSYRELIDRQHNLIMGMFEKYEIGEKDTEEVEAATCPSKGEILCGSPESEQ